MTDEEVKRQPRRKPSRLAPRIDTPPRPAGPSQGPRHVDIFRATQSEHSSSISSSNGSTAGGRGGIEPREMLPGPSGDRNSSPEVAPQLDTVSQSPDGSKGGQTFRFKKLPNLPFENEENMPVLSEEVKGQMKRTPPPGSSVKSFYGSENRLRGDFSRIKRQVRPEDTIDADDGKPKVTLCREGSVSTLRLFPTSDRPVASADTPATTRHIQTAQAKASQNLPPKFTSVESEASTADQKRTNPVSNEIRKVWETTVSETEPVFPSSAQTQNAGGVYSAQIEAFPIPTATERPRPRTTFQLPLGKPKGRKHTLREKPTQVAFAVGCVAVTGWTGILVELLGLIEGKGIPGPAVGFIVMGLAVCYLALALRLLWGPERKWAKPLPPVAWAVGIVIAASLLAMVILGIVVGIRRG